MITQPLIGSLGISVVEGIFTDNPKDTLDKGVGVYLSEDIETQPMVGS